MSRRRAGLAGLVTALVAAAVVLAAPPGENSARAAQRPAAGEQRTVTLLTGDRVVLGGGGTEVSVEPAAGRERLRFRTRTDERGHVHVVPGDVLPGVAAGTVDERLFDVTGLLDAGYDDASRDDLPLIVDYAGAAPEVAGATAVRPLAALGAEAVRVPRSATFWATAQSTVERVWLDAPVRASLDRSVPRIGAPEAWAAGHTGAGSTVAVLDTGIDTTHPDLSDAVAGEQDFTGGATGPTDVYGHGTHVASIITGNNDTYRGVAPDTKLLNGKVLDDDGYGQESWIIAGMEWAATSGADVVNMSLGNPAQTDGTDPMSVALNDLTAKTGALFVVAAGNTGPMAETVGSPGAADAALTVGAVDHEDHLAEFSSRGPRVGDGTIKPEITAPGVGIVAARASGADIGEPVGENHTRLSGTSMATPHVAGAAAILAGQHPDWAAAELKASLVGSATPTDGLTAFEQGAGRVDVAAATTSPVLALPTTVNGGVAQWPHDDDEPIRTQLTYRNTGAADVTLRLAPDVRAPDGKPAPAGMFTVDPAELTVPAGGTATATLVSDTAVAGPDGRYAGVVTATGDGFAVRTPATVLREVESYDVTLRFVGDDGAPTTYFYYQFTDLDRPEVHEAYEPPSTTVVRLPRGRYMFETAAGYFENGNFYATTLVVEPQVSITEPTELVIDSREAEPIGFTTDKPNAAPGDFNFAGTMETSWTTVLYGLGGRDYTGMRMRPSRTSADDRFTFWALANLAEPDGAGGFAGSPYLYHLRYTTHGSVPSGLLRHVPDNELVTVRSEHAVDTPGTVGMRDDMVTAPLPFTLTEYYTPDVPFFGSFSELDANGTPVRTLHPTDMRAFAADSTERWNVGVAGPALPVSQYPVRFAERNGNVLSFLVPMDVDQAADRETITQSATEVRLFRDGEPVEDQLGYYPVPPEEAGYRLAIDTTRNTRLSTKISAEWGFRSAQVDGALDLPLLCVRFAPDLDLTNTAPAGAFEFPVYVQRNTAEEPGPVHQPEVEVSYDDGATWRPVSLRPDGDRWIAAVDHPAGAEFASVRASVSDDDGNTAKHTITRAYAIAS